MPQVRIKNGPSKGQTYDIGDHPLNLGRDPSCAIQILDKGASRNHSELFRIGEMCFIRDLSSRNGTFVNDTQVDEELLREGDRIQIGATVLIFESVAEALQDDGLEFSSEGEDSFGQTMTLRLEDLSTLNVSSGTADGTEGVRLRSLYRLSRLLSEIRDQEELVKKTLDFCCGQIGADAGYIFIPDPKKGNIVPVGQHTKTASKGSKISRSIIRRALQEKRAILTSDAMQDARFAARESIVMKQIHSVICAPLSATGDFPGVLYMASHQIQQVFDEEDLELVAAMGEMIGLALESARIQREQRQTFIDTVKVLVRANEMRDPSKRGQSERIASYANAMARQLGFSERKRMELQLAALLHNVGSLVVDGESLFGVGRESTANLPTERKRLKATLELVDAMPLTEAQLNAIRYIDERMDGSGPEKLSGEDIPLPARILAVSREFETRANPLETDSPEDALRDALISINRESGRFFDAQVVKALLVTHRNGTLYTQRAEVADEDVVTDPRRGEAAE